MFVKSSLNGGDHTHLENSLVLIHVLGPGFLFADAQDKTYKANT